MMETDPKKKKSDEDSSTKYILEYYQKYSQNRDLPKYFSGTSLTYLPPIVDKDESELNLKVNLEVVTDDQQKKLLDVENLELSPAGSVASNRKLEWDNMADIGYDNAKSIHRSSSLPLLPQLNKKENLTSSQTSRDTGGSNIKVVTYPNLSSSEEKSGELSIEHISSSSPLESVTSTAKAINAISESSSNEDKVTGFKQTLEYLKTKIGSPIYHSTPCDLKSKSEYVENITDTPFIKKEKVVKTIRKSKSIEIAPKNVDKVITKSVIENDSIKHTKTSDLYTPHLKKKVINLCLTKPVLLDCVPKTDKSKQIAIIGTQTENIPNIEANENNPQIMNACKQSNTDKERANTSSSNSLVSNCDSFEYYGNNQKQRNDIVKENVAFLEEIKLTETTSKNAAEDVERHIYILQKLLKSKRYNSSTKKRYIKKIVRKISESQYLQDSTTSSELFYPKTDPSKVLDQIKHYSLKNKQSSSSCESLNDYQIISQIGTSETVRVQNIIKESSKVTSPKRKKKVDNSHKSVNNDTKKELSSSVESKQSEFKDSKKGPFTISTKPVESSEKKSMSTNNWKDYKTNSEELFESKLKSVGDGDHLLINFADKERQYQLNWIDREITHLGKLKSLLLKPRNLIEQEGHLKRTTSIYMVRGVANDNKNVAKRNYVIETELGIEGVQPSNFRINGQNYIVEDPDRKGKSKKLSSRPVVADIEVNSDSQTTNIKVTTFCSKCKKTPCICNSVLDDRHSSTDNFQKNNTILSDGAGTSSSRSSKKRNRSSIQLNCVTCGGPCVCYDSIKENESSKCLICKKSPCVCHCVSEDAKQPNQIYSIPIKGYMSEMGEEEKEVCLCDLIVSDGSSNNSLKENQPGSLGKIFINCKCDTDCECNCDFVNKLLKHFNKQQMSNLKPNQRHSEAQVRRFDNDYKEESNHSPTQVLFPVKDDIAQTLDVSELNVATKKSQNVNNVNIVISNKKPIDEEVQTSYNPPEQLINKLEKQNDGAQTLEFTDISVGTEKLQNVNNLNVQIETPSESEALGESKTDQWTSCKCFPLDKGNIYKPNMNDRSPELGNKYNEKADVAGTSIKDHDVQTFTEVNVATDKLQNINNVNSKPTKRNSIETGKNAVKNKYTPDDLYNLISRIEQALLDKNILQLPDVDRNLKPRTITDTASKPKDEGTMYTPPKTVCVLENISTVLCDSYKPDEIDGGSICTLEIVCDQGTSYSPPPVLNDKGVPDKLEADQCICCKPVTVDEGVPDKPEKHFVDKSTIPEPRSLVNKGTKYNPKITQIDKGTDYSPKKDKKLEGSKDKKIGDMSFCMCTSKKDTLKSDKDVELLDKKKRHHQKSCPCNCKHCSTSSAASKEDTTKDAGHESACKCGIIQKNKTYCKKKISDSTTSREDTTSDALSNTSDSTQLLVCSLCHRQTSYDKLSMLRTDTKEYVLCPKCMEKRPILTSVCYVGPDPEKTSTHPSSDQSATESHCTCLQNRNTKNWQYCSHCRSQLKRTLKSKQGIAYTLTLEEEVMDRSKNKKHKKKSQLQEIKVKVPCPYNRKKVKNQENIQKSQKLHKKDERNNENDENLEFQNNCFSSEEINKNSVDRKDDKDYTLQEYLKKNRPDFIDSAEYRRQILLNNRDEREQNKDDIKLKFLEEYKNDRLKRLNKLFNEQEMREITKRNYKKLPEVQQRANILRMQKLRSADKFITDIFKKKIQNCILKGKSNFPIDSNIVNYYR